MSGNNLVFENTFIFCRKSIVWKKNFYAKITEISKKKYEKKNEKSRFLAFDDLTKPK